MRRGDTGNFSKPKSGPLTENQTEAEEKFHCEQSLIASMNVFTAKSHFKANLFEVIVDTLGIITLIFADIDLMQCSKGMSSIKVGKCPKCNYS